MLGVNSWDEPKDVVSRFVTTNSLRHRILLNGGETARAYGVEAVPTVFWIDRDGRVADVEMGFDSAASLETRTNRLLSSKK